MLEQLSLSSSQSPVRLAPLEVDYRAPQLTDCCSIGLPSRGIELAVTVTIKVRRCDVAAKLSGTRSSVALAIMCTRPRLFDGYYS